MADGLIQSLLGTLAAEAGRAQRNLDSWHAD
jgi:hypothetical protein